MMRSTAWATALMLPTRAVFLVVTALVLLGGNPWLSVTQPVAAAPNCQYVLGFAALRDQIVKAEGTDVVGSCLEDQYHATNGDGVQWTNNGLFVWRKATNWTGFTQGTHTWVSGTGWVGKRSNSGRFAWEATGRPDAVSYLTSPSSTLPPKTEVDEAIRQVYVLDNANDGSTFNLYFGDLAGTELYAVSLYPDRGVVVPGRQLSSEVLRKFLVDNADLLSDPRGSVGTWFNAEDGMTYLDVSTTIADRKQAIELGTNYNQISIFDLSDFEEIPTGGTGEPIPDLPPAAERLPQWPSGQSGLHD